MVQAEVEGAGGRADGVSAQPARDGPAAVVVEITAQPWSGQAGRSLAHPCAPVSASQRVTEGRPAEGLAVEMLLCAPTADAGAAP